MHGHYFPVFSLHFRIKAAFAREIHVVFKGFSFLGIEWRFIRGRTRPCLFFARGNEFFDRLVFFKQKWPFCQCRGVFFLFHVDQCQLSSAIFFRIVAEQSLELCNCFASKRGFRSSKRRDVYLRHGRILRLFLFICPSGGISDQFHHFGIR